MKLHNGNLIVLRTANPCPKDGSGPWFRFGNPGNLTGRTRYDLLMFYIGTEAAKAVRKHFKCFPKNVKISY